MIKWLKNKLYGICWSFQIENDGEWSGDLYIEVSNKFYFIKAEYLGNLNNEKIILYDKNFNNYKKINRVRIYKRKEFCIYLYRYFENIKCNNKGFFELKHKEL